MGWLLLIKNTETGETKIWESERRSTVIRGLLGWNGQKLPVSNWRPDLDEFVMEKSRHMSFGQIAKELTVMERRPYTKNMVVGRYRDLRKIRGGLGERVA